MITLRKAGERGQFDHGWLRTAHTFSFADYYDPKHIHFSHLRVINDDYVAPGEGFDMHPHRDMEIVTYVLEGALAHKDSMGNGSVIRPGEVQRMSAGTGVLHSEFNGSPSEWVHLLQIWILPEQAGIEPGYEQKNFPLEEKQNRFRLIASRDGRDGSVTIHQNASIHAAVLENGASAELPLAPGRRAWVHVARGQAELNGIPLAAGDGAGVKEETTLRFKGAGKENAEILVFDLA